MSKKPCCWGLSQNFSCKPLLAFLCQDWLLATSACWSLETKPKLLSGDWSGRRWRAPRTEHGTGEWRHSIPNCWQLCDRSMIEIERIPDQRAVKVGVMLLLVYKVMPVHARGLLSESHWFYEAGDLMGSVWVRLKSISPGHLLWEEPSLVSSRGSDQAFLW